MGKGRTGRGWGVGAIGGGLWKGKAGLTKGAGPRMGVAGEKTEGGASWRSQALGKGRKTHSLFFSRFHSCGHSEAFF